MFINKKKFKQLYPKYVKAFDKIYVAYDTWAIVMNLLITSFIEISSVV